MWRDHTFGATLSSRSDGDSLAFTHARDCPCKRNGSLHSNCGHFKCEALHTCSSTEQMWTQRLGSLLDEGSELVSDWWGWEEAEEAHKRCISSLCAFTASTDQILKHVQSCDEVSLLEAPTSSWVVSCSHSLEIAAVLCLERGVFHNVRTLLSHSKEHDEDCGRSLTNRMSSCRLGLDF